MNDQFYPIDDQPDGGDYLPDSALDAIGELVPTMPSSFHNPSTQAYQNSVMAKLEFDRLVGPLAQEAALTALLRGATCTPTLYRNLVAARAEIARLKAIVDAEPDDRLRCGVCDAVIDELEVAAIDVEVGEICQRCADDG